MNEPNILPMITRRLSRIRGGWRLTQKIQSIYSDEVRPGGEHLVTINDYDRDLKLRLDKGSSMGSAIYWQGYYSKEELMLLGRILQRDSIFVDVGANNGYFTVFAAKRVPDGRVLSFEPVSSLFENLRHNIALNNFNNVDAFKLGLADGSRSELDIFSSANDSNFDALATIYPDSHRSTRLETIALSSLDKISDELKMSRIDVIKIDVEGAELDVLRGAHNILTQFQPLILIEVNKETYTSAGYAITDVTDYLQGFNYSFQIVGNNGSLSDIRAAVCPNTAISYVQPPGVRYKLQDQ